MRSYHKSKTIKCEIDLSEFKVKQNPEKDREETSEEKLARFQAENERLLGTGAKPDAVPGFEDLEDRYEVGKSLRELYTTEEFLERSRKLRECKLLIKEKQALDKKRQDSEFQNKVFEKTTTDTINNRAEILANTIVKDILDGEREKLKEELYRKAKEDLEFKESIVETSLLTKYKQDLDNLRSRNTFTIEEREKCISIMSKIEGFKKDASIVLLMFRDLLGIKIERYTMEDVLTVLEGMKLNKYTNKVYPAEIGDNIGDDKLKKKMINNIVVEILKDRNIEIQKRISTSGRIRNRTYYYLYKQDVDILIHMRETYRKYSNLNKEVEV